MERGSCIITYTTDAQKHVPTKTVICRADIGILRMLAARLNAHSLSR
jgi:hypothetical protein